jgi:hypothetical protein
LKSTSLQNSINSSTLLCIGYVVMMTTYIKDQSETSIITIKKLEDTKNKDIAQTFESINTWINDDNTQITQLLKYRYGQYMGNTRKYIFWSEQYPNVNCSLCHIIEPDTWRHILLCCTEPYIHKLRITRHNKVVQHIRKSLISNTKSRCFTPMNTGKFNGKPQENTLPNWLLPCSCNTQTNRCQYNARLRPDILCIQNLPYNSEPPTGPQHNLTIQFIEFTYYNDRYSPEKSKKKQENM